MNSLSELVFVGFNSRVAALNRETGEIVWSWKATKPSMAGGYVTLLLDGERLIVSVNGYMYCLHAETGEQLWYNETKGFGTGVASLASIHGYSASSQIAAVAEQAARAAAASAGG
ncbi:MAG: PQQ-binding-like beta-propeller repeat protein [Planctomycetia bacterium]|nr:PQQ-binding-like beta-propeller repeat protein [Planctomycetia bacterium]